MNAVSYTMFLGIGEALPGSDRATVVAGRVDKLQTAANGVYLGC